MSEGMQRRRRPLFLFWGVDRRRRAKKKKERLAALTLPLRDHALDRFKHESIISEASCHKRSGFWIEKEPRPGQRGRRNKNCNSDRRRLLL